MKAEIKDGIVNTFKGKRPFKVRVHGRSRMSSFATFEEAKKANDKGHEEAMSFAAQVMDGWRQHSGNT